MAYVLGILASLWIVWEAWTFDKYLDGKKGLAWLKFLSVSGLIFFSGIFYGSTNLWLLAVFSFMLPICFVNLLGRMFHWDKIKK